MNLTLVFPLTYEKTEDDWAHTQVLPGLQLHFVGQSQTVVYYKGLAKDTIRSFLLVPGVSDVGFGPVS